MEGEEGCEGQCPACSGLIGLEICLSPVVFCDGAAGCPFLGRFCPNRRANRRRLGSLGAHSGLAGRDGKKREAATVGPTVGRFRGRSFVEEPRRASIGPLCSFCRPPPGMIRTLFWAFAPLRPRSPRSRQTAADGLRAFPFFVWLGGRELGEKFPGSNAKLESLRLRGEDGAQVFLILTAQFESPPFRNGSFLVGARKRRPGDLRRRRCGVKPNRAERARRKDGKKPIRFSAPRLLGPFSSVVANQPLRRKKIPNLFGRGSCFMPGSRPNER